MASAVYAPGKERGIPSAPARGRHRDASDGQSVGGECRWAGSQPGRILGRSNGEPGKGLYQPGRKEE